MPWRLVPPLALLAGLLACTPTHLDLPQSTGGRALPADATIVRFVIKDRDHAMVRISVPDCMIADSTLTTPDDPNWGDSIRSLVLHKTLDAASRRPIAEEIPVVFVLDDDLPLIIAKDVLFDPVREAAQQDPRIQLMLATGDLDAPEVIDIPDAAPPLEPYHPQRSTFTVRATSDPAPGDPSLYACTFAPGAAREHSQICAAIIEEELVPVTGDLARLYLADAIPWYAEISPKFMQQLCDALDERFDLEWEGETIDELARIVTHDPRPPRCRGGLWISEWWYDEPNPVRPSELRQWRRSLADG